MTLSLYYCSPEPKVLVFVRVPEAPAELSPSLQDYRISLKAQELVNSSNFHNWQRVNRMKYCLDQTDVEFDAAVANSVPCLPIGAALQITRRLNGMETRHGFLSHSRSSDKA